MEKIMPPTMTGSYVTFDADGRLTGRYRQPLHPDHAGNYIMVDDSAAHAWPNYRANAARDGLESLPPPEPAPPPVPQVVTRRQGLQALLLAGALDNVQPLINAIPDLIQRRLAQIEFDNSQTFERQRPLVLSIGSALELDLDKLFTTAATL